MSNTTTRPAVAVCMGSQSDWTTMQEAAQMLEMLDVPYEAKIISAHRTPDRLASFARGAADAGCTAETGRRMREQGGRGP